MADDILKKTATAIQKYESVRVELKSANDELTLLKEKRDNLKLSQQRLKESIEILEEYKKNLIRGNEGKEMLSVKLDQEISFKKEELENSETKKREAEDKAKFAEQETEEEKKRREKNIQDCQNRLQKIEGECSQAELSLRDLKNQETAVKIRLGEFENQERVFIARVKAAETRLSEVHKYIDEGQIKLLQLTDTKYAIKNQHDEYKRDLDSEKNTRSEYLDKREIELNEREVYVKRQEEIFSQKAIQLREIKSKLEQYLGKPIRMII